MTNENMFTTAIAALAAAIVALWRATVRNAAKCEEDRAKLWSYILTLKANGCVKCEQDSITTTPPTETNLPQSFLN